MQENRFKICIMDRLLPIRIEACPLIDALIEFRFEAAITKKRSFWHHIQSHKKKSIEEMSLICPFYKSQNKLGRLTLT